MGLSVVDLFSGAGGFSAGFRDAGFEIVAGLDIDLDSVRSFSINFPKAVTIREDARLVRGSDIVKYVGDVDVVIGGPPCEAYTGANPRRMRDPLDRLYLDELGQLTLEFIRLVGELKPRVFVMENVAAITEGGLREALINEFRRVGYSSIHFNILHAEDYAVPSIRRRAFISNIIIKPPKVGRLVTVADALRGLPEPTPLIPNHELVTVSGRKIKGISRVNWGQALYAYRGSGGMYRNFIRLHPGKPAPTVMGSVRFIHPFEDRLLTVREQARLMGFPDTHIFTGSKDSQFNQVGEAVPPPLAKAIAEVVKRELT
ncbi:DNA cytosine methyltransferase [Caldivirga sp. UBA161]|uniref:DNA cytosine methyltransferase n=1 Tax=Caldivirga sp. UBA161 TaxID=1915569 RepID=UPI0025C20ECB|nr:DNA cytosine methyltransferase [Caldivirga sp. UBA161]